MDSPAGPREEHVLADGTHVAVRPITPEDGDELRRAFAKLSPRSRYQRFLGGVPHLTDDMVHYLTEVDGDRHVALVAVTDSLDMKSEVGVGVARFVRLRDQPDVAEAAVAVVDDMQGRGVGTVLLRALARVAREHGVRTFRGLVLADNLQMRQILDEAGARLHAEEEGAITFDVALDPPDAAREHGAVSPLRMLLRAVARLSRARRAAREES